MDNLSSSSEISLSSKKSPCNLARGGEGVNPEKAGGRAGLVRAAGIIGLLTLVSRILGMLRDIVCARSFGTGWQWDGFIYAFMFPNFLRRLVGEGALSTAFIPVYSEILEKEGREASLRFANVVLTALAAMLALSVLLVEAGLAALLSREVLPPTLHLTADLLRIFFPYLLLISLYALGMGILHCHRHFFSPALGPVILNGIWIAAVLWLIPHAGQDKTVQLRWLAGAILAAGFFQLAAELPGLFRQGYRPRWTWKPGHPGLIKSIQLLTPAVLGFAIMQINILVDMTLAFLIGPGANSSLWYGNRLMQFPLGLFAIAMGTALLPMISSQAARGEADEVRKTLSFAMRNLFLIILPSAVGLIVMAQPIVQLLFQRGEFDALSTARTSAVLIAYSIGLFAYAGQKVVASGFYASQDPKTPMQIGVVALVANIVFNLILMRPLGEAGLALATSLSGILQFGLLCWLFVRRHAGFPVHEVGLSVFRITLAASGMGAGTSAVYAILRKGPETVTTLSLGLSVLGAIGAGVVIFLILCWVFRVGELREAWIWIRERRRKGRGSKKPAA